MKEENDSLKAHSIKTEESLRIETVGCELREKMLNEKLDKALAELKQITMEKNSLVDMEKKYKELIAEKENLQSQLDNLSSSKQLLQNTMNGQLGSLRTELEEVKEAKEKLMNEYKMAIKSQEELLVKYKTEQGKTKTLLDEVRILQYKRKS